MTQSQSPARLIIVSNRLPFQLVKQKNKIEIKESDGGLVSALKSYFESTSSSNQNFSSVLWIGSADFNETIWQRFDKKNLDAVPYTVQPIFIEKKTYAKYYNGFCNATLWPLFHYFPSFVEFERETFISYEEVNRLFAERILSIIGPNDTVWIHDYQLLLLPGMIRQQKPDATIGFFLHIPFPSFEIFRLLHRRWKEKIIDGLLGADLIGFHTHEYVQHFLKTVQMIKGYDHQFRSIFFEDRMVKVEMFSLGIDFNKFHQAAQHPEVMQQRYEICRNFAGKKILFSVDRLDYTKGITHRLSGFERFLELNPEWHGKVIFILVVVPSREIVSKYNERKQLIEEQVGSINGRYCNLGWQPIIYRYNSLSFYELVALYSASDVGLITPLRDGMNLVAKEYVASQTTRGVLILSELAGAANELSEAVLVNPMDKDEMAGAILQALRMEEEVQQRKIQLLQNRLRKYTVSHWTADFLTQLQETKSQQNSQHTRQLPHITRQHILERYAAAKQKLLLLDYDGTLVPFATTPVSAIPDKNLLQLLRRLAADEKTDLTIISGRDSKSLERWFGSLPVNLVSEHGAGIRLKNQGWQHGQGIDQSWKGFILPMLELFSQRSPGSFIEDKVQTLVWHYRNVETELGFIRSRELLDNLQHLVRNANLHIIDGNRVIEIRVSGIDKGAVTKRLLSDGQYDFVLAIGDDKTDEDMFRVLAKEAFTIKIGLGHTVAQYYLPDQGEVRGLLEALLHNTMDPFFDHSTNGVRGG